MVDDRKFIFIEVFQIISEEGMIEVGRPNL